MIHEQLTEALAPTTCEIQWVDDDGKATPDTNPSIGRVRTKARESIICGRTVSLGESRWFRICAKHAEHMSDPGMDIWEWEK